MASTTTPQIRVICDERIDPSLVPDDVWDTLSAGLSGSIRRIMQDPRGKADYEEWRKKKQVANG